MSEKHDIETMEDIRLLVDTFYDSVRKDPLIGPIFIGVIKDQWPAHLDKMYRFWQTILFDERTYSGSPFLPHAGMPLEQQHFEHWLALWFHTVDGFFEGERANEAKWRGQRMATMFLSKIGYYRNNKATPLI